MIRSIQDLPQGIDGLDALGRVSKKDYDLCVVPLVEQARKERRRIRLLYRFGPDFDGFTAGGVVADAMVGLRNLRRFERCAVLSDVGWLRKSARLCGRMMPCPLRVFGASEVSEAVAWLGTTDRAPGGQPLHA
jgi:SpoIIAA-like